MYSPKYQYFNSFPFLPGYIQIFISLYKVFIKNPVLLSRKDSFKAKIDIFCITHSQENKNELETDLPVLIKVYFKFIRNVIAIFFQ